MAKASAAIIVGYMVMVVWVVSTLQLGWSILGPQFVFEAGSYTVSELWLLLNIALGLIGGVLGGYVCTLIAGERHPVGILAVLVLALGLVLAVIQARAGAPGPALLAGEQVDLESLTFSKALSVAVSPWWFDYVIGPIGAVGVYIGGMLRLRRLFG